MRQFRADVLNLQEISGNVKKKFLKSFKSANKPPTNRQQTGNKL